MSLAAPDSPALSRASSLMSSGIVARSWRLTRYLRAVYDRSADHALSASAGDPVHPAGASRLQLIRTYATAAASATKATHTQTRASVSRRTCGRAAESGVSGGSPNTG